MRKTLLFVSLATLIVGCGNSLECGKGTVERNGECVASGNNLTTGTNNTNNITTGVEVTCGAGTVLLDGECVVSDPTTCGAGTQLDANSGECVVTARVCGPGTAFNGAAGRCEPTSRVCADGTTFNVMMGVCMADSQCQPGDTLTGGLCLSSLEAKIASADLQEAENNDPSLGGTADEVTLPAVGGQIVLAASVGAPIDLDGDMVEDQDVDVITFDAAAGVIVQVSLERSPGPDLSYRVEGPGGYLRESGSPIDAELSRGFVITETGEYTLTVAPARARTNGLEPYGGDEFVYALTFETFDVPAGEPTDLVVPTTITDAESRFPTVLTDAMNFTAGELVLVEVNPPFDAILIGWDGQQITSVGDGFGSPIEVPASGALTVVVDVVVPNAIEVSARPSGALTDVGFIAAGTSVTESIPSFDSSAGPAFFRIDLPVGTLLEVTQTNDTNASIETEIDGAFTSLTSQNGTDTFGPRFAYAGFDLGGGSFLVEVSSFAPLTNLDLTFAAVEPTDEGMMVDGTTVSLVDPTSMARGKRVFFTANSATELVFRGSLEGGGDLDLLAYESGLRAFGAATNGDETFQWIAPAGGYLFELRAFSASSTGYVFDMTASDFSPIDEVEPNDDVATATTGLAADQFVRGLAEDVASDWYAIDILAPAVLELALQTDGPSLTTLDLRNPAGENVRTGQESFAAFVEPGTYYVVVTRDDPGAAAFEYLIGMRLRSAEAGLEDLGGNDASATAQPATPGVDYTIAGTIVSSADQDWYRFDLAAATTFRISGQARATFYDAVLTEIVPAGDRVDLPAGVSYVAFEGFVDGGPNDYRLRLSLPPERLESSAPAAAIPDDGFPVDVVADTITIQGGPPCTITSAEVGIDITHSFQGDLRISLQSPNGTVVTLHGGGGGATADLTGIYPLSLLPVESLDLLVGEVANGDWTLTVGDAAPLDSGTLNSWSLGLNCQ